ncbi:MAG: hypothetical protein K1X67_25950 [Fimbriimonadaceae bacterium]|nr:hypothetical protein [Fimbriimonadaceae bacterium]
MDSEIADLEIPLARAEFSPKHVSADYYYRIRERPVYKTYPIYAPGREPAGYFEWLQKQEPEIIFDAAKLKTEADWIAAGELVFENPDGALPVTADSPVRNPAYYEKLGIRLTKEGVNPYQRYVIREKGKVELRIFACADCHTRVLDDGRVVKGAQSNFPHMKAQNFDIEKRRGQIEANINRPRPRLPWAEFQRDRATSFEELLALIGTTPPGVFGRHRANGVIQLPDLIGVKNRKYLDRTGLQLHRGIADLMRYASMNQDTDMLSSFRGYTWTGRKAEPQPDAATWRNRFSDPQLYALALFLYSLQPPANPHKFDGVARRGQKVFQQQGWSGCHTPPLYTNNKLTPVDGFTVPETHKAKYDVMSISVGTDPKLALDSLRGTGYYKVPSLRGVWYRGPTPGLGHDARRLVRSEALARRLCADGLRGPWCENESGQRARVRITAFRGRQTGGVDCFPENTLRSANLYENIAAFAIPAGCRHSRRGAPSEGAFGLH